MKLFFGFLLLIFCLQDSYSNDPSTNPIGLQLIMGPDFSIGRYGTKNSMNDDDGYTKLGHHWGASLYALSNHGFGGSLNFDFFSSSIDYDHMQEVFNSPRVSIATGAPGEGNRWLRFGPSIGLTHLLYLNQKRSISARFEGKLGYMGLWRPDIYFYGATNYGYSVRTTSYFGPLYAFRTEFGLFTGQSSFLLTLGIQYSYSRQKSFIEYGPGQVNTNFGGGSGRYQIVVPIHSISLTIGIGVLVDPRRKNGASLE